MREEQNATSPGLHSPRFDDPQSAHGRRIKRGTSPFKILV
eukprot:CAMPEP_0204429518 /NCGR_PEP_ID=MMETSP0470-20130426/60486_1 /ASSEMBLY_ACC=CAM_ASM_000385 /TAXON_ID=2969 /ORGANISM="Oxyrrhis marina" /LENGTH=39 /DNA_ID= /DNA_START= /DNA_END= /DNA_ORIENTATION=